MVFSYFPIKAVSNYYSMFKFFTGLQKCTILKMVLEIPLLLKIIFIAGFMLQMFSITCVAWLLVCLGF